MFNLYTCTVSQIDEANAKLELLQEFIVYICVKIHACMFDNIQIHTVKREFQASVLYTTRIKAKIDDNAIQCFRLSH